jgi:hypothetical protein
MSKPSRRAPPKGKRTPSKSVGKPCFNCPKAKSSPKKAPCDFDRVNLKCSHNPAEDDDAASQRKKGVVLSRHKGLYRHDADVVRGGASSNLLIFDLVAAKHPGGFLDLIRMVIGGGPGYHCSKGHPHVVVRNAGKVKIRKGLKNVVEYGRRAGRPPSLSQSPWTILRQSFRPPINIYAVHVIACGVRPAGYPVRTLHFRVRVFPVDVYKIELSIPSAKKQAYAIGGGSEIRSAKEWKTRGLRGQRYKERSVESSSPLQGSSKSRVVRSTKSRDGRVAAVKVNRSWTNRAGRQLSQETTHSVDLNRQGDPSSRQRGRAQRGQAPSEDRRPFSFTVNNGEVETSYAISQLLHDIVRFKQTIQSIKDFVNNFQPQVGWKFTWELEFLAGTLTAEWGYKEDIDHTVFLWWKLAAEITALSAMVEISFGIDLFGVTLKVYGRINGAVKLERSIEGTGKRDKTPAELVAGVSGAITGRIAVVAQAGANWFKGEASVETSLKPRFQIRFLPSFKVICRVAWSGIKAEMEFSSKSFGFVKKQTYEIMPSNERLANFEWPKA